MGNIYKEFNNIEIDLSVYDNISLSDEEILKYKKSFLNKKITKKSTSKLPIAALIFGVIVITLFTNYNEIYANIDKVTMNIKSFFTKVINRDINSYIDNFNSEITDKNITVKLNEVLIDGNELVINRTIDYSMVTEADGEVYENINEIRKSDNLGEILVDGVLSKVSYSVLNKIDDNTYNWISVFAIDNINANPEILINNEFTYTTPIKEDNREFGITNKIQGDWIFNFKLDSNEITKNVRKLDVNKEDYIELSDGDIITLSEVTKSNLSIKINYDVLTDKDNEEYSRKLYVVNSKGERINNSFSRYKDKKGYIQFYIDDIEENNYSIKYYGSDKTISLKL